ncbi:MAG: ABC transporter permease [Pseudoflavonifractor sp.]
MLSQIFSVAFITTFLSAAVRMALPITYAALGETISEKAGIINVGIEALMLSGAFFSFVTLYYTGSMLLGFLGGILAGVAFSMLHAFLAVYLRQDHTVSGVALNFFALGITSFLFGIMVKQVGSLPQTATLSNIPIPLLCKIPIIGEAFFNRDIITYLAYFLIAGTWLFLNKSIWGMSLISVGENPQAADTVGLPVFKLQYLGALFNGIMGGLGGAYLVIGQLGVFSENATSGRGYIALAVVVFGKRNPIFVFLASLFFGAAQALQFRLQALGIALPSQFFNGLPYVLTVLVLLLSTKKNSDPAALGTPYIRSMR